MGKLSKGWVISEHWPYGGPVSNDFKQSGGDGATFAWLAARAEPGTVIGLDGDLGAGKTAFSKQFAQHLGVNGVVNSPTFTIIKEYEGRLPLYHMDVYRLSIDEADELGLDEYFWRRGLSRGVERPGH